MNKETRLILENQESIMRVLFFIIPHQYERIAKDVLEQRKKILEALNPKESNTEENIKRALE